MAFPTSEQVRATATYSERYGEPFRTYLEVTGEPYGILWLRWLESHLYLNSPNVEVHIKPDGSLIAWERQYGQEL